MDDFQLLLDKYLKSINLKEDDDSNTIDYDIYHEIREKIISARYENGITQKQLSKMTGITQSNISNIEKGISKPTIDSLRKIADAIGKRLIVDFVDREEVM